MIILDGNPEHDESVRWAKNTDNARTVVASLIGDVNYQGIDSPAATFLAGTPGAGKTEFSKNIMSQFVIPPVRIDLDELREKIPGYDGTNANIYQDAATILLQKTYDYVTHHKIPFILDGTFAYKNTHMNIKRVDRKGYSIQIYYIYQDPGLAWGFTQVRREREGRIVPLDIFIDSYFESIKNVKAVLDDYPGVELAIIIKNIDSTDQQVFTKVHKNDIDNIVKLDYTKDDLRKLLIASKGDV